MALVRILAAQMMSSEHQKQWSYLSAVKQVLRRAICWKISGVRWSRPKIL